MQKKPVHSRLERGQITLGALMLVPVFLIALGFVIDYGRFIILRNQVKMYADGGALAAAGALNVHEATMNANFVLDPAWARTRVISGIQAAHSSNRGDSWMTIRVTNVWVSGSRVEVTVQGEADALMLQPFGIQRWRTSVTSRAKAATGITGDVAP